MPSPFPGMDPYLEDPDMWPDVHLTLLTAMRAAIVRVLPERYTTLIDRYIWLYEPETDARQRFGRPDIAVVEEGNGAAAAGAVAVLAAPVTTLLPIAEEEGPRYLRILDRQDRRVVTVVELLSPDNKTPGEQRNDYLTKRRSCLHSGTNLVEIDLLRAGQRPPLGMPPPAVPDYCALVSWAHAFPRVGIWPFSVRDPLPRIPIPLAPPDADLLLDMKPCLDRTYDEAGYAREIDYTQPPELPLTEPDATWARGLLSARPPQ